MKKAIDIESGITAFTCSLSFILIYLQSIILHTEMKIYVIALSIASYIAWKKFKDKIDLNYHNLVLISFSFGIFNYLLIYAASTLHHITSLSVLTSIDFQEKIKFRFEAMLVMNVLYLTGIGMISVISAYIYRRVKFGNINQDITFLLASFASLIVWIPALPAYKVLSLHLVDYIPKPYLYILIIEIAAALSCLISKRIYKWKSSK